MKCRKLFSNSIFCRFVNFNRFSNTNTANFIGLIENMHKAKVKVKCEKETEWNSIPLPSSEVQLNMVLACGQTFRWKSSLVNPSEWTGVFGHHVWTLRQTENELFYKIHNNNEEFESTEEAEKLLKRYFQLDISLATLYKEWSARDPKFPTDDYPGIRILKQDPIETIFAFICSSNNNISRISGMVEKLCVNYGQELCQIEAGEGDKKTWFDFPPVEKLCCPGVEKKLREEGFGYRAAFIVNSASKIVANGGDEWVTGLSRIGYEEARKQLQSLPGIGRKVADCICLMALGYHSAIPVDTHIHQVGKLYLPHLAKVKTLTDKVYSEISEYFQGIYGDYAGWAQSVLFASRLRHLQNSSSRNKLNSENNTTKTDETETVTVKNEEEKFTTAVKRKKKC